MGAEFSGQFILLIVGQFFTVAVVILTFILNWIRSDQALRNQKKAEYLEKQLTNFYGPIYILLSMNDSILKEVRYNPDTGYRKRVDEESGETNLVPGEVWSEIRDNVIRPNNQAIIEIIRQNIHLIDSADINQSIVDFVVHAEVEKRLVGDKRIPREDYEKHFAFPKEFQKEIYQRVSKIKSDYYRLIGKR